MTNLNQNHRFYRQAYSAYAWISFSPERRAIQELEYYEEVVKELAQLGKESAIPKFEALFLKSLAAKSRCASPMVTGPAKFPVERMKKYNQWERNTTQKMFDFVAMVKKPKVERIELDYKIEQSEYMRGDVKVLHNVEENRLQLFFNGKPDDEKITMLKKNGYKWSPRFKAWQRQLTPNAITSLRWVLP